MAYILNKTSKLFEIYMGKIHFIFLQKKHVTCSRRFNFLNYSILDQWMSGFVHWEILLMGCPVLWPKAGSPKAINSLWTCNIKNLSMQRTVYTRLPTKHSHIAESLVLKQNHSSYTFGHHIWNWHRSYSEGVECNSTTHLQIMLIRICKLC